MPGSGQSKLMHVVAECSTIRHHTMRHRHTHNTYTNNPVRAAPLQSCAEESVCKVHPVTR